MWEWNQRTIRRKHGSGDLSEYGTKFKNRKRKIQLHLKNTLHGKTKLKDKINWGKYFQWITNQEKVFLMDKTFVQITRKRLMNNTITQCNIIRKSWGGADGLQKRLTPNHLKRYSASLIIREMKIKTIMKHCVHPLDWQRSQNLITLCWWECKLV